MTNFENIKAMDIDAVADYIYLHDDALNDEICKQSYEQSPYGDSVHPEHCKACVKRWLESEVNSK